MDPQRWQRITDLFDAALERPPSERASFLGSACAADPALGEEVRSLLAAHDRDPAYLEASEDLLLDLALAAGQLPRAAGGAEGRRIGHWVLRRRLGAGRAGTVYLAEQADRPDRCAAVRLLDPGWAAAVPAVRARATPGAPPPEAPAPPPIDADAPIARWLEAGLTSDGGAYVVMEFVEGQPIDEHCAQRQLSLREQVALCAAACDAIQHAHQRLTMHGMLGPRDVLVTGAGKVKVVDVGLLALLSGPAAAAGLDTPGDVARLAPTEHTSPEQIRGEPATTASDVYALGVLLYELLTGARPFVFATRSRAEIERLATQGTLVRPSVAAPAHRRQLAGALDAIVLTAMHRDPARRYPSAAALAEDLRRQLRGASVSVVRETTPWAARRWARQHPWATALTWGMLTMLAAAAAGGACQARRAQGERRQAAAQLDAARQSAQTLMELFSVARPPEGDRSAGDTLSVRTLLQCAERETDALSRDPARQARRWRLLADLYRARGDSLRAGAALRRLLAYQQATGGADSPAAMATRRELDLLERPAGSSR